MTRLTVDANEDGVISAVHGGVEAMTGWTEAELVGQNIETLVPLKYLERHRTALDTYVSTGRKKVMGSWIAVECLRKDGSTLPIMLVVTERNGLLQGLMEER